MPVRGKPCLHLQEQQSSDHCFATRPLSVYNKGDGGEKRRGVDINHVIPEIRKGW